MPSYALSADGGTVVGTATAGGRLALVTGATSGIGEEIAVGLARQGFRLALTGRSSERGQRVIDRVRSARAGADPWFRAADLSRQAELRRLVAEVDRELPRLDVLVNNAGGIAYRRETTDEGVERTIALNVLAPFLLTQLLLPRLAASAGASTSRVVNVASSAHRAGRLRLDDLEGARRYSGWSAYSQSKLALILLTYEASRRFRALPVTFNACHPGFVRSRFGHRDGGVGGRLFRVVQRIGAISAERGATTPVYVASAPEIARTSGAYFVRSRARASSGRSHDLEAARALWAWCEARTGTTP